MAQTKAIHSTRRLRKAITDAGYYDILRSLQPEETQTCQYDVSKTSRIAKHSRSGSGCEVKPETCVCITQTGKLPLNDAHNVDLPGHLNHETVTAESRLELLDKQEEDCNNDILYDVKQTAAEEYLVLQATDSGSHLALQNGEASKVSNEKANWPTCDLQATEFPTVSGNNVASEMVYTAGLKEDDRRPSEVTEESGSPESATASGASGVIELQESRVRQEHCPTTGRLRLMRSRHCNLSHADAQDSEAPYSSFCMESIDHSRDSVKIEPCDSPLLSSVVSVELASYSGIQNSEEQGKVPRNVSESSDLSRVPVLSECGWKTNQMEEVQESSQQLSNKVQKANEAAVRLQYKIAALELENTDKEKEIKRLNEQLAEARKSLQMKNKEITNVKALVKSLSHQLEKKSDELKSSHSLVNGHAGKTNKSISKHDKNQSQICVIQ